MALTQGLTKFTTASPILTSYNYTDIAEGTGIQIFYGCGTTDSGGADHILTSQTLYSSPIITDSDAMDQADYTLEKTINFDLTAFNMPKTIKGIASINGSFAMVSPAGSSGFGYVVFTIYHYDGSTETSIGTATTETVETPDNTTKIITFCLQISLTTQVFAKGSILRTKAEIYGKAASGTSTKGKLAHDPKNRDSSPFTAATNTTQLVFHVPFKLEV